MADVLLHVTCLRRDGYQTAYEGARVVCEVLARPKGLQAFRVLSMDESTAIHPAQMPPPRTHVTVAPTSGLERAQVKWFNRLRGFGFLTRGEGTPDIFVHMETLRRFGLTELRPGQFVLVRYRSGPEGHDGGRSSPRERLAGTRLALAALRLASARDARRDCRTLPRDLLVAGLRHACRARAGAGGRQDDDRDRQQLGVHAVYRRTCDQRRGARARPDVPQGCRRATACCSTSSTTAGRVLDAQHLHLARHDLHRAATDTSCASPKMPSRCRID